VTLRGLMAQLTKTSRLWKPWTTTGKPTMKTETKATKDLKVPEPYCVTCGHAHQKYSVSHVSCPSHESLRTNSRHEDAKVALIEALKFFDHAEFLIYRLKGKAKC